MDVRFVETLARVLKHEDWPKDILTRDLRINAIRDAKGNVEVVKIEFSRPGSLFQIFMGNLHKPRRARALWIDLSVVPDGDAKEAACALIDAFLVRHQITGVTCVENLEASGPIALGALMSVAEAQRASAH